ncbi:MAG: thiamine pyrophosphate-dependent dehydrogenase E1 component subunit alpha [Planctomycetes bacterium]|jgi:2-oxoisovalerate dehydrogenase E1 component alpha subunit|nr:thiamine pyrophosphate-dependent dehydrogenase E1 component subunit alpha [Planctomycetota bacterium]MBT4029811.1 thiamine pyrophosphate-dependent dehydrogenase E1 component subunit alpha [Planctomycetota bacterium]MBT4559905.1 thiamine pyrophosphate-dependent dehydrogenase E1 component subunit alpha [Planctomycetota bacterium]MBT5100877.1 thiamine pyrophosphate-dependent dehydrogenase E1 component subunit alpha [Planctomycetota bacterium]MBT7012271.1 thiamine pyrophosphate-dependent dehydro
MIQILDPKGNQVGTPPNVDPKVVIRMYRAMVATRQFDDRAMKLQRTGKVGFSIPNEGIEAVSAGAAAALDASKDWIAPHYRDFAMALFHGVKPQEMMDNMFGNQDDHARGRQMPVHFTFTEPIRWLSISSPLGTQVPNAVGIAMAMQKRGEDGVVLTSFGDGSTSTSGFHSGMNFAGVTQAPVVFLCQNNQYAISCPVEKQTASSSFAIKGEAYGIPGVKVDGNDVLAVYDAVKKAVDRARNGGGPTLIEALTFRMGGHSTSDDPRRYIEASVMDEWAAKDPIARFRVYLEREGILHPGDADDIQEEFAAVMKEASEVAEGKARPALETIFSDTFKDMPEHLKAQRDWCISHYSSRDESVNEKGEFPL